MRLTKQFNSLGFVGLAWALTCCSASGSEAKPKSFFGEVFLHFVTSPLDAVVGLEPVPIDLTKLPPGVDLDIFRPKPFCTGFFVAPTLILTAAHCLIERFVIRQHMLSSAANFASQIVIKHDSLHFSGQLASDATDPRWRREASKDADVLAVNTDLDAAVIAWRGAPAAQFFTLAARPPAGGEAVATVGHPAGLPLAIADHGHAQDSGDGLHFDHDLDTLGGNSGGPVMAAGSGDGVSPGSLVLVLGLHVQGGVANHFTAAADVLRQPEGTAAAATQCERMVQSGAIQEAGRSQCLHDKSTNRAILAYRLRDFVAAAGSADWNKAP